jgi:FAS-associated factor 2
VALLHCSEGPTSSEALLERLARVVEEQGAVLVAAQADEEERTLNRRLREEQDAAYEASVQADRVSRFECGLEGSVADCRSGCGG